MENNIQTKIIPEDQKNNSLEQLFKEEKIKNNSRLSEKKEGKNSKMRIAMIVFMGYRNLRASKLRSFLTISGVAIGIGIVTFLICVGFGIQSMVINEVTKNNAVDVIDISNNNLENLIILNNETIDRIKGIEGVKELEILMNTGGKVYRADSQTDSIIFGSNKEYFTLARIEINEGNLEDFARDNGVVISSRLAKILSFSSAQEAVGQDIEFDLVVSSDISSKTEKEIFTEKVPAKIIGVINNEQETFLYAPYGMLKDKFGIDSAQLAKIITDEEKVGDIRSQVEQMGFTTESITDLIKDINAFFNVIRIVMIILGTIIMSISAMGMLNTLSVSLLQRTKEVGILKALGAKRKDIFKMFVFEAAIISFSGGFFGFFGGYLFAILVNFVFNMMGKSRGIEALDFVYIPYYFIFAIVAFILFLGMVTGILPAKRAAGIHALDALRYE